MKHLLFSIFSLILLQTFTFYTFAEKELIKATGQNHESYVWGLGGNIFNELAIVSPLQIAKNDIKAHFDRFKETEFSIHLSMEEVREIRNSDNHFVYYFYWENQSPFLINKMIEVEAAKEYGAVWESKHVWLLFTWILIEKINTGIS